MNQKTKKTIKTYRLKPWYLNLIRYKSILQFLNEILTLISKRLPANMKKNLKLKYKKIDSKELISTLSDIKKTSKTFNWKPKNSIDEIISSCINNFSKI